MIPTTPPALLRIDGMAAQLSMSARTLRRLVERRKVPVIKPTSRLMLFDPADVLHALKARRA